MRRQRVPVGRAAAATAAADNTHGDRGQRRFTVVVVRPLRAGQERRPTCVASAPATGGSRRGQPPCFIRHRRQSRLLQRRRVFRRRRRIQRPPYREHVSARERRLVDNRRRKRRVDHRRQPAAGFCGGGKVQPPGQNDRSRPQAMAVVDNLQQKQRPGRRFVAVRSPSGRAQSAAAATAPQRIATTATVVVGRVVQMVLEEVVVRVQDRGVFVRARFAVAPAFARATAAVGDGGQQRGAIGRSTRSKVRFQQHRRWPRHRRRLLRTADRDRFQRLSKRSHGHVG